MLLSMTIDNSQDRLTSDFLLLERIKQLDLGLVVFDYDEHLQRFYWMICGVYQDSDTMGGAIMGFLVWAGNQLSKESDF